MKTQAPVPADLPACGELPLWLTQYQVARALQVSTHQVTWLVRRGDLAGWWMLRDPAKGEANRAIRYRRWHRRDVLAYVARESREGRAETERSRLEYAAWRARQEKIGRRSAKPRKAA
jgi:hypothetical protein